MMLHIGKDESSGLKSISESKLTRTFSNLQVWLPSLLKRVDEVEKRDLPASSLFKRNLPQIFKLTLTVNDEVQIKNQPTMARYE